MAQIILPNDLSITKTYSGIVQPGATIETTIVYQNNWSVDLSGVKITDNYSQRLTFDYMVSSYPDVSTWPVVFNHDAIFHTMNWDGIAMSWNSSGEIILRYTVSPFLPPNINVINEWIISIWCVLCQDPYTVNSSWFSIWYVNPHPRSTPLPYDLGISSAIPLWDAYISGEYFYVDLDLTNDTYTWQDIMLNMTYKSYLLKFVDVSSSGWINFPPPITLVSPTYNNGTPWAFDNDDETTMLLNWFGLNSWTTQVTLRFLMTNDYTSPTDVDFNIGIPDEYWIVSTIWETNPSNNHTLSTVQSPPFDLRTTVSILTWDEVSTWVYDASGTVTFRINFWNSWHARNNAFLYLSYYDVDALIGYTSNNYGPVYTWNSNGNIWMPELWWWSVYRRDMSIWTWETWYIDVTFNLHDCWAYNPQSYISIMDNYDTLLWTQDPWANYYMLNRARETDISNNVSDTYILSNWICTPSVPGYNDSVISGIYDSSLSWLVLPWQIVTFWVPFYNYSSNYWYDPLGLWIQYDSWLTFLWLVATGGDNTTIVDNMSGIYYTDIYNNQIMSNSISDNSDIYYIYQNPWSFATWWQCDFAAFPTGNPLMDNPNPIRPFMSSNSWVIASVYMPSYTNYKSLWYDELYSHIFAFIDTQAYIYSLSNSTQMDVSISWFSDRYYACSYNKKYNYAINNLNYTTWWANIYANNEANQAVASLFDKTNLFTLCESSISLFSDGSLCDKNYSILRLFYDSSQYIYDSFGTKLTQTMDTAYAIWLTTSWFRQLLVSNIMPIIYWLWPVVRQYSLYHTWSVYSTSFCSNTLCIDQSLYDNSIATNTDITYNDYLQIISAYDPNFYSWLWIPRSWWYISTRSLLNNSSPIFIDDFSQPNKIQIDNITSAIWNAVNIWLQFVVNELSSWTVINITGTVWSVFNCDPSEYSWDYNHNCLTDISRYYSDTLNVTWWNSWDIVLWDDNVTWTSVVIWDREPYNLSITKTMNIYTWIHMNDIIEVTTIICNSGASRSDINITEEYPMGMAIFQSVLSWTNIWVPHIINPILSQLNWQNVTINSWECKQIITQYKVTNMVVSWSIINFYSNAWAPSATTRPTNTVSGEVTWSVTVLQPNIYSPYGEKEILGGSNLMTGGEVFYRITYSNPGNMTWIMNLYDIYETWLLFSGVILSTQWLTGQNHDILNRTITRSNVVVPPYSNYDLYLSFIISTGKAVYDTIENDFSYSMLFVPENYITDIDRTNNQSSRNWSYYLNIFEWTVLEDINHNALYDITDMPLSWVSVSISQSGILIWTTITSSTWYYIFDSLLPWDYVVSYAPLPWYTTIVSFTWTINNSWSLGLNGVSILSDYPFYSSIATDNITLMDRYVGPVCWNNIIETWEVCDDWSNNWLARYCNTTCTDMIAVSLCGNWVIDTWEQCDDGNNNNGDACSAICQLEIPSCTVLLSSYISNNPLEVWFNINGFGFGTAQILYSINYWDSMIDTNITWTYFTHQYTNIWPYTISATVVNPINTWVSATCNLTVQSSTTTNYWWWGWTDPVYYCGDGIVNNSEQCDDGNSDDNDSCTNSCVINDDCSITDDCWHGAPPILPPVETSSGFDIIKIIPRTWAY